MARASLVVAFSLLALAAGDADQSCSNGEEEAALLQVNSGGKARRGGCGQPEEQKNNWGTNMPSSPGAGYSGSQWDCQNLCSSDASCKGWTFMTSTQTGVKQCWLKDGGLSCPAQQNQDQYNHYISGYCHGECDSSALLQVNSGSKARRGGCG